MPIQTRTIRYRLYPNREQEATLNRHLAMCRNLYNAALEQRIFAYRRRGISLSVYDQGKEIKNLRAADPEWAAMSSQVPKAVLDRLDKAFQNFFRRLKRGEKPGFPRFQGAGRFTSMTFPTVNSSGTVSGLAFMNDPEGGKRGWVKIQGVGEVRCIYSEPLAGRIRTVTIKKEVDEWYLLVVVHQEIAPLPHSDAAVGIDLGLAHFVTTSDGEHVANPRHFVQAQAKLRRHNRSLARKRRNSKRRHKQRILLAKHHRKVTRQRRDFHHKLSRRLVNQYGLIAHEELNIRDLSQSRLAKDVLDVAWGGFLFQLTYKAAWAGRRTAGQNPAYTSQRCSCCGHVDKGNRVSQSLFRCKRCGHTANADVNAAKNVLWLAQVGPSGANAGAVEAALPEKSSSCTGGDTLAGVAA